MRDFSLLTHHLTQQQRSNFAKDIRSLVMAHQEQGLSLIYDDAASLSKDLKTHLETCKINNWAGKLFCSTPAYLTSILDQAKRIETDLISIKNTNGALFYDFDQSSAEKSLYGSFDYYVSLPEGDHELYRQMVFDQFKNDFLRASDISVYMRHDPINEVVDDFYLSTDAKNQHGISRAIDADAYFDLADKKIESLAQKSKIKFSAAELVFMVSCVSHYTDAEQSKLIDLIFSFPKPDKRNKDNFLVNNIHDIIINLFNLVFKTNQQAELSASNMFEHLTQTNQIFRARYKEIKSTKFIQECCDDTYKEVSKKNSSEKFSILNSANEENNLSEESFYKKINDLLTEFPDFYEFKNEVNLSPIDLLSIIKKLHYMSVLDIKTIIYQLDHYQADIKAEIDFLSGLSFDDMIMIINDSRDDSLVYNKWKLQDGFRLYYQNQFDDKFTPHHQEAKNVIKNNPSIAHVTAQMASLIILIESNGDKNAISSTKAHFGLMQIGTAAYKQIKGIDLSLKELKQKVTGSGWKENTEVGTNYLEWCFDYFNPTKSLAIAASNYNKGVGNTLAYRMHHMYKIGQPKPLFAETREYMAKYLAYTRIFKQHNAF
ncbi:hypothetical protein BVY03_05225 [bacterium K02(2017)]|nr:hypothetical protein BVY03_05225 [bacterium K02(2017)]